jgi:hypothetical protein
MHFEPGSDLLFRAQGVAGIRAGGPTFVTRNKWQFTRLGQVAGLRIWGPTMLSEFSPDSCLECAVPLEIVSIRFRFRGVEALSVCPNCCAAFANKPPPLFKLKLKRRWTIEQRRAKIFDRPPIPLEKTSDVPAEDYARVGPREGTAGAG